MALIKCEKCGKDISSSATRCVHCGIDLTPSNKIETLEEKNILTLLKYASVLKIIFIVCAVLFFVAAIAGDFTVLLIGSLICVVSAIIGPAFIENKALILKNVYEINKKGK